MDTCPTDQIIYFIMFDLPVIYVEYHKIVESDQFYSWNCVKWLPNLVVGLNIWICAMNEGSLKHIISMPGLLKCYR